MVSYSAIVHDNLPADDNFHEESTRRKYPRPWSQSRTAQLFCQLCGVLLLVYTCLGGTSLIRENTYVQQTFVDPASTLALLFGIPLLCSATVAAYIVSRNSPEPIAIASGEPNFDRCALFCFGIPAFVFVVGSIIRHLTTSRDCHGLFLHISNSLGVVAVLALSIMLVPVARHNVICRLFGWNTAAAVRLHMGAGILVLVAVVGHVSIYLFRWITDEEKLFKLMFPPVECLWNEAFQIEVSEPRLEERTELSCYPVWRNFWGGVAAAAMVMIGLSGFVRRRYYSLFYRIHILAGSFMLLGAVLHWHRSSLYLAGGAVYYMACGLNIESPKCQLRAVDIIDGGSQRPCLAITVAAKDSVAPGQYVKFSVPELSQVAHPFTANTTSNGDLQVIFRCVGPFTTQLMERLSCEANLPSIFLDGMYGCSQRVAQVSSHDVSLIIAGGIGITPYLSLVTDAKMTCPKVILHWLCRDTALIHYVEEHYLSKKGTNVQVVIHQTGLVRTKPSIHLVASHSNATFCDTEMQQQDIESIQVHNSQDCSQFVPSKISFFTFVAVLWIGLAGVWVCHRSYDTTGKVLPRIFGPCWVLFLYWIIWSLPSFGSNEIPKRKSNHAREALSLLCLDPSNNGIQATTKSGMVFTSSGRPPINELLESIQVARSPGVFACGPAGMLQSLRKAIKRENVQRTAGNQIALYEEVFDL